MEADPTLATMTVSVGHTRGSFPVPTGLTGASAHLGWDPLDTIRTWLDQALADPATAAQAQELMAGDWLIQSHGSVVGSDHASIVLGNSGNDTIVGAPGMPGGQLAVDGDSNSSTGCAVHQFCRVGRQWFIGG